MTTRNITMVSDVVKIYSEHFEHCEFHYLRVFNEIVAQAFVTGGKVNVFVTSEEKTTTVQHYIDQFRRGFRMTHNDVHTKTYGYMAMKRLSGDFLKDYAETQNPNALMMGCVFMHGRADEFEGAFRMLNNGQRALE